MVFVALTMNALNDNDTWTRIGLAAARVLISCEQKQEQAERDAQRDAEKEEKAVGISKDRYL